MIGFIDDQRQAYGVEPICKVLPIAPSTPAFAGAGSTTPMSPAAAIRPCCPREPGETAS